MVDGGWMVRKGRRKHQQVEKEGVRREERRRWSEIVGSRSGPGVEAKRGLRRSG